MRPTGASSDSFRAARPPELLSRAFAGAGRKDSAAAHYCEVVRAWEKGDAPFQARRKAALDWLALNPR